MLRVVWFFFNEGRSDGYTIGSSWTIPRSKEETQDVAQSHLRAEALDRCLLKKLQRVLAPSSSSGFFPRFFHISHVLFLLMSFSILWLAQSKQVEVETEFRLPGFPHEMHAEATLGDFWKWHKFNTPNLGRYHAKADFSWLFQIQNTRLCVNNSWYPF